MLNTSAAPLQLASASEKTARVRDFIDRQQVNMNKRQENLQKIKRDVYHHCSFVPKISPMTYCIIEAQAAVEELTRFNDDNVKRETSREKQADTYNKKNKYNDSFYDIDDLAEKFLENLDSAKNKKNSDQQRQIRSPPNTGRAVDNDNLPWAFKRLAIDDTRHRKLKAAALAESNAAKECPFRPQINPTSRILACYREDRFSTPFQERLYKKTPAATSSAGQRQCKMTTANCKSREVNDRLTALTPLHRRPRSLERKLQHVKSHYADPESYTLAMKIKSIEKERKTKKVIIMNFNFLMP
jgi:hypothetical protein